MNMVLMRKWIHIWNSERNKCWNVWIRKKYYCLKGDSLIQSIQGKNISRSLGDILHFNQSASLGKNMNNLDFEWKVNNGRSILFREDIWHQGQPLMNKFPKLYQLSKWKQIEVVMFKNMWIAMTIRIVFFGINL